ncbi:MAG: Arc family DNA-binding protein [Pseudomonadota bacterium]
MANLVIRNLPDDVKERLRVRAATHGRSMEAEARAILETATGAPARKRRSLGELVAEHFGPETSVDLDPYLPPRAPGREPPSFD